MVRGKESFLSKAYSIADFIIIQISFVLAWILKFKSGLIHYEQHLGFTTYGFWSGGIYGSFAIAIGYMFSFYVPKRKKRFAFEIGKVIQVHFVSMLFLLSFLFLYKAVDISRAFLVIFLITNIVFIILFRLILKVYLKRFRSQGFNKQFVLIVGAGQLGNKFNENIEAHPELGYEAIGFLDDNKLQEDSDHLTKPIIGKVNDLKSILQSEALIDEVVIALPIKAHEKYGQIISECEKAGIKSSIIPDFYGYLPAQPSFDNFAGLPVINIRDIPLDILANQFWKRLFDILFAILAILLTSPVMLLIALGIKLTSSGPILFRQERVGLNRRTFIMYKFRTMNVSYNRASDTQWTTENDPRKTRFGSFLRKTSLDELPQFFNVLKGDMSVVGPRPERPYFVDQFKEEIPKYMVKHHVRPGITGWAQANGLRGDTSIKDRIVHDIFYIENWTLLFDLKIIWKTILNGFINKNAY